MKASTRLLVFGAALAALTVPAAAEPVTFGASLPLTGGLAINGQKHKEGYELCIDLINKTGGLLGEPATLISATTSRPTRPARRRSSA